MSSKAVVADKALLILNVPGNAVPTNIPRGSRSSIRNWRQALRFFCSELKNKRATRAMLFASGSSGTSALLCRWQ
ncbi:hypothetical protein ACWAUC_15040 [Bradyrhizobium guangdongense]